MNTYSYTPFKGELELLQGPELAALRDVSEGWFVDYKRSPPAPKDLARHLSAFANQHGGWLFLGVEEDTTKGMKAGSFPGVPNSTVPSALVNLREASSAHVSPPVYFETKAINGPVPEIGLPAGRAIVIVGIPEGTNAPYIHSSGKIYRRVGDHSDPKEEIDRHVLDLLWGRSARTRQRLEDFLTERPMLSVAEKSGLVHAYVYFLADPHFAGHQCPLSFDQFTGVMGSASKQGCGAVVPFSNTFPTADGFVARQVKGNDPLLEGLTLRWWKDGNVRISIPINVYDFKTLTPKLDPRQLAFLEALRKQGFRGGRIAEFSIFILALAGVTDKYLELRNTLAMTGPFFGKIRLCDVWRIIPFISLDSYLKAVDSRGTPVVQDQTVLCPPGLSSDSLVEMNDSAFAGCESRGLRTVLPLALQAFTGVGISFSGTVEEFTQEFVKLLGRDINQMQIR